MLKTSRGEIDPRGSEFSPPSPSDLCPTKKTLVTDDIMLVLYLAVMHSRWPRSCITAKYTTLMICKIELNFRKYVIYGLI